MSGDCKKSYHLTEQDEWLQAKEKVRADLCTCGEQRLFVGFHDSDCPFRTNQEKDQYRED